MMAESADIKYIQYTKYIKYAHPIDCFSNLCSSHSHAADGTP